MRRRRVVQEAVTAEPIAANNGSTGVTVDPASVRPQLAAAAANLGDIRRVLLETATGANKQLWATISCKHCSRAGRYEITVPDNKVRLDAVQALLHESLGRPAQAEPHAAPSLPGGAEQVRSLNWENMVLVFATQFADEVGAVSRDGGDVLLRERLAALSSDERQLLREALSEPELV